MKKITSILILITFFFSCVMPPQGFAQTISAIGLMPIPGSQAFLSPVFTPANLKGMVIHPDDPFKFDFIINRGDEMLSNDEKQVEYPKLIKYFLASLAVPDTDQWVNLSPFEQDRIIPDNFGLTEMGRDLLAQDYLLKQISSSLTNPDSDLGKKFWAGVYEKAYEKFGTTDIPTETINKVWITPDKAVVYEKGNTVYVLEHHLKVMMEKDYLATRQLAKGEDSATKEEDQATAISHQVMTDIIIPAIEKEVNESKNFAPLRQVYSGMLLASWYKGALKESILNRLYADKGKVKGIDQDPKSNQEIYDQYLQAFKKGVFNMIREDVDAYSQEIIPRKYFSGGAFHDFPRIMKRRTNNLADKSMISADVTSADRVSAIMTAAWSMLSFLPKTKSNELVATKMINSAAAEGARTYLTEPRSVDRQFEDYWYKKYERYLGSDGVAEVARLMEKKVDPKAIDMGKRMMAVILGSGLEGMTQKESALRWYMRLSESLPEVGIFQEYELANIDPAVRKTVRDLQELVAYLEKYVFEELQTGRGWTWARRAIETPLYQVIESAASQEDNIKDAAEAALGEFRSALDHAQINVQGPAGVATQLAILQLALITAVSSAPVLFVPAFAEQLRMEAFRWLSKIGQSSLIQKFDQLLDDMKVRQLAKKMGLSVTQSGKVNGRRYVVGTVDLTLEDATPLDLRNKAIQSLNLKQYAPFGVPITFPYFDSIIAVEGRPGMYRVELKIGDAAESMTLPEIKKRAIDVFKSLHIDEVDKIRKLNANGLSSLIKDELAIYYIFIKSIPDGIIHADDKKELQAERDALERLGKSLDNRINELARGLDLPRIKEDVIRVLQALDPDEIQGLNKAELETVIEKELAIYKIFLKEMKEGLVGDKGLENDFQVEHDALAELLESLKKLDKAENTPDAAEAKPGVDSLRSYVSGKMPKALRGQPYLPTTWGMQTMAIEAPMKDAPVIGKIYERPIVRLARNIQVTKDEAGDSYIIFPPNVEDFDFTDPKKRTEAEGILSAINQGEQVGSNIFSVVPNGTRLVSIEVLQADGKKYALLCPEVFFDYLEPMLLAEQFFQWAKDNEEELAGNLVSRPGTTMSALEELAVVLNEVTEIAGGAVAGWKKQAVDILNRVYLSPEAKAKRLSGDGYYELLDQRANAIVKQLGDSAMKGGIDLNAANLDLQIKRDGAGVPLPVSQQDLDNIKIDGLVPVILNIQPAANVALF